MKIAFPTLVCCLCAFLCCKVEAGRRLRTRQNSELKNSIEISSRRATKHRPLREERKNMSLEYEPIFPSKRSHYRSRRQRVKKSFVTKLAANIQSTSVYTDDEVSWLRNMELRPRWAAPPHLRHSGLKGLPIDVERAFKRILLSINCRRAKRFLTTVQRCAAIQSTPFKHMKFYLAAPDPNTLYSVILPDGKLKDATNHHGVAVVDPFPNVGFGHLVLIFYIDKIPKSLCDRKRGLSIGPHLCLTLARKNKICKNLHRSQLNSDEIAKKCEVNFLPLVYNKLHSSKSRRQTLQCHSHAAGFGKCMKPVENTPLKNCDLLENNRGCHSQKKTSKNKRKKMLCQSYSTCDRSILIFGEWTNLTFHPERKKNLQSIYKMLTKNGYQKSKIQLFNAGNGNIAVNKHFQNGFNSVNKYSLRHHISGLCKTDLCVDSFTIYMNGPALTDGSILLQDFNQNGIADESEIYRVKEFFDDISNCAANHVIIFADQSYSGILKTKLRQLLRTDIESWKHVVLFTSGGDYDYSWYRGATENWRNLSPKRSISWAFENLGSLNSSPTLTSRRHAEDYTLYGASFPRHQNVDEINWNDVMSQHMGCQELPLPKWIT